MTREEGKGNKNKREEREGGGGRTPHLLYPSHHTTPIDILPVLHCTRYVLSKDVHHKMMRPEIKPHRQGSTK